MPSCRMNLHYLFVIKVRTLTSALLAIVVFALPVTLRAAPLVPLPPGFQAQSDVIQVRAVVHRGGAAVGPRGAAYRGRTVAVGPRGNVAVRRSTVVRPGWNGGGVRWARPGRYYWPRGGAIAAGAAIGFVTAATAAAWAGAPPAPGMCWYYTDPSRTQGFWDYCQ
jgi:hypothetical protein